VKGTRVQVGSRRLARRMGWVDGVAGSEAACMPSVASLWPFGSAATAKAAPSDLDEQVKKMGTNAQTVCYLGLNGQLAAVFGVADAPRPEARQAVRDFAALGVDVIMLTGDRNTTAMAVASQLGIQKVRSELLPEDKVTAVRSLKEEYKTRSLRGVAMIGDGVNDAAALAASTVGVAMGAAGTQVAVESAHVVLMDSDLNKLVLAIQLGRHAVFKIKQNIAFSVVSKVAMLVITFAGYASLWGAIAADVGAMLIVVLNSSLVLSQRRKIRHQAAAEP